MRRRTIIGAAAVIIAILSSVPSGTTLGLDGCIEPPLECPNYNVTHWLYTSRIQNDPYKIVYENDASVANAPFITDAPLIILIHGYTGHRDFDPNPQIRPAYLNHGDYNVITVDYNPLVREPCYLTAVHNLPLAGKCTAEMLDTIVAKRGIALKSVHVIGFSLGAHVAGEIGKWLKSGKLPRITGLDPAMPLFVTPDNNSKLDKSDAIFVQIVHTNAMNRGKLEPLGHIDFYVNGGSHQPGCENMNKNAEASCNHARAPYYFGESITTTKGFYGMKCDSYFKYVFNACGFDEKTEEVIMGAYTPEDSQGLYFVNTNSESPYAKGKWEDQHKPLNDLTPSLERRQLEILEIENEPRM